MCRTLTWKEELVEPVVLDIVAQACQYQFVNAAEVKSYAKQCEASGRWLLDSLSTYQAVSFVTDFFGIDNEQAIQTFLEEPNLFRLVRLCTHHLNHNDVTLTFYTSGTTGKPKAVMHKLEDIVEEVGAWADAIEKPQQVLSTVPLNHIYGFIWAVALPLYWGVPSIDKRSTMMSCDAGINQLIVSIPAMAHTLLMTRQLDRPSSRIVFSTAPCEHEVLTDLAQEDFHAIYQIYGSTETGGVGIRDHTDPIYGLRSGVSLENGILFGNKGMLPIQDILSFKSERRFTVEGRKDEQIQVNGYNVEVSKLADELKSDPDILDAHVEVIQGAANQILSASIRTKSGVNRQALKATVIAQHGKVLFAQNIAVI